MIAVYCFFRSCFTLTTFYGEVIPYNPTTIQHKQQQRNMVIIKANIQIHHDLSLARARAHTLVHSSGGRVLRFAWRHEWFHRTASNKQKRDASWHTNDWTLISRTFVSIHFHTFHIFFFCCSNAEHEWSTNGGGRRTAIDGCENNATLVFSVFLQMIFRSSISVPCEYVSCWQLMNVTHRTALEKFMISPRGVRSISSSAYCFFVLRAQQNAHEYWTWTRCVVRFFFLRYFGSFARCRAWRIFQFEFDFFYSLSSLAFWYVWICGVKASARDRRF